MMRVVICIAAAIFCFSSFAQDDGKIYDNFHSIRAMAMGNAYTAIVRDADSLLYNPAGLARVGGFDLVIADPYVGVSGVEAAQQITELQDSENFADTVAELYGTNVTALGGAKAAFVVPYLGVGIYDSFLASLDVQNPVYPNLDIAVTNDFAYVLGAALPLGPFTELGFVGKYIQRTGSRVPFGPSFIASLDPESIANSVQARGNGYALDMGANLSIPGPVKIALSGVWRNVGETVFTPDNEGDTAPPKDPNEIVVGGSVEINALLADFRVAADIRHLNRTDVQLGKKMHIGTEVSLPLLDLRAGFHQGYYTAGAGIKLGLLRVDVATWGVELGDYPGQREDRRYAVQATLELGFDAGLSFLGGGSGGSGGYSGGSGTQPPGRRLKQRR
jgi:hypothetical protein